ncbi:LPS export ABC transporter periplasmic protein LptC [Halodesulfovibrio sp.]|jgi:LPS export ABC transporter protein LptC|uniref:LPS export ABC transporter periplasmic protein LptC n=1 Tax=Halodesulfovibrio sp. TaxID=1912772 RepID=UPI0025D5E387|nr:LPS export ABC transporter periplasmic protein LptC [Halodesulfovibrio sp.]MCT4534842.1 LPS export ABC transporter periplasmic protein LptC [Halodesulfovibrio sp.]
MRKWLIWGVLLVLIGGGLYYLQTSVEKQIAEEVKDAIGNDAETNVDLSLQGIELKQGEDGKELWTLKASNGWYQKDESIIDLAEPDIMYFVQPNRDKVHIVAPHGTINQREGIARLWGDVTVSNPKGTITSSELSFEDKKKMLFMTGSVTFTGEGFAGSSDEASWNLKDNQITATGNVTVQFRAAKLNDAVGGEK